VDATSAAVPLGANLLEIGLGREASRLVLGIGQPAIDHDVELARFTYLDLDGALPARLKPSLHTEDFWFVASGSAVVDDDGHGDGPWRAQRLRPVRAILRAPFTALSLQRQ